MSYDVRDIILRGLILSLSVNRYPSVLLLSKDIFCSFTSDCLIVNKSNIQIVRLLEKTNSRWVVKLEFDMDLSLSYRLDCPGKVVVVLSHS